MARLDADGTIVGYTVRLKPEVEEQRIRAFMTVAVEGNQVDAVHQGAARRSGGRALYSTNGRWDIVAELRADSLEAFDRVLGAHPPDRGHLADRDQSAALDVQVLIGSWWRRHGPGAAPSG